MRIMKEGGVDALKLEGASHSRIAAAKEIVGAGIAVMGHVGLTPHSISVLGGFKAQGRNTSSAVKVLFLYQFNQNLNLMVKSARYIILPPFH